MKTNGNIKWIVFGALVVVIAAVAGTGIARATSARQSEDQPITGGSLERASAAALASTGGGTVTESEVGDGDAAYSVEVTMADGSAVDVMLDSSFKVIGTEADDDRAGADESADDDGDAGEDEGSGDD